MQKQQGMTLIGMLLTVVVLVMAAIVVMRLVPVYIQHYEIVQSIKSLNTVPVASLSGDPLADVEVLRSSLNKRLDINGVDNLKNSEVIFTPNGEHRYQVRLKYQAIRFLAYNINLLINFDDTYEVVAGSEN
ncbi:DUF4845 domain-containing protein [Legionella maioricensis]|uniref:DUF4845 domain-containing protein n=1 Tax=Legionella maioricensis TaxID=2896528 RepID=A0A9X2CXE2_9GAMM|nr:DUF4845 domain-containing protein [Legionella maioricensis]MCL9682599.1 DUF4845 domain-containing protein [Legionella maioricensis]MCL9686154.1 DUF4845 domain-containing protein [Legionella maioricensis]